MRRAAAAVLGITSFALGLAARDAWGGATIDLLFTSRNGEALAQPTNALAAAPGDLLTLAVLLRSDEPLTIAIFALGYDHEDAELDVVAAFQWHGTALNRNGRDRFKPLGPLDPSTPSFVGSFQGVTSNLALPRTLPASSTGYQMGTVVWRVTSPRSDGEDILSGLFNVGIDAFADEEFSLIDEAVTFHAARVNALPEPSTAALLALGLAGLAAVARQRRARAGAARPGA
jgi:hypothetical protein